MTSPNQIANSVVSAVRSVVRPSEDLVLLHRPYLPETAWDYLKDCLDTGWVSSAGSYVTRFEEELARITGCKRAVAVVNGTAALQVCLLLAGVQTGDEVLCPSLTFVATANAIRHAGGMPHFVDVDPQRLGLSPQALENRLKHVAQVRNGKLLNRETGKRIAAVCPMHCFGIPCDMDPIIKICERYDLPIVEDAAESLGSYYKGKHTGRFGKLAAVSFNGNKIVTTGGGGAILTDDADLADRAKHLTTTAKVPHAWEFYHDEVGWNYRMPNINAALGLAQLEKLSELLAAKRELAENYAAAFGAVDGVQFLNEPEDSTSNHWLNCVLLENGAQRDVVLDALNRDKLQCRPLWRPMHELPMYETCPQGPLPSTGVAYQSAIVVPSSSDLGKPGGQLVESEASVNQFE